MPEARVAEAGPARTPAYPLRFGHASDRTRGGMHFIKSPLREYRGRPARDAQSSPAGFPLAVRRLSESLPVR